MKSLTVHLNCVEIYRLSVAARELLVINNSSRRWVVICLNCLPHSLVSITIKMGFSSSLLIFILFFTFLLCWIYTYSYYNWLIFIVFVFLQQWMLFFFFKTHDLFIFYILSLSICLYEVWWIGSIGILSITFYIFRLAFPTNLLKKNMVDRWRFLLSVTYYTTD